MPIITPKVLRQSSKLPVHKKAPADNPGGIFPLASSPMRLNTVRVLLYCFKGITMFNISGTYKRRTMVRRSANRSEYLTAAFCTDCWFESRKGESKHPSRLRTLKNHIVNYSVHIAINQRSHLHNTNPSETEQDYMPVI